MTYTAARLVRDIARMDPEAPDYEDTLRTLIGQARAILDAGAGLDPDIVREPQLTDEDKAVTYDATVHGGDVTRNLMPHVKIGGIEVSTWRERGRLQVDVDLANWDGDAGTHWGEGDEGRDYLGVDVTVAGVAVHSDEHELADTCFECGDTTADGEGWAGRCGNCADRAESRRGA